MYAGLRSLITFSIVGISSGRLWAGGSGLNVVVVVNQNSTNSVQLGNYYAEQRQVPPQNFLRINWSGGKVEWTEAEFTSNLYNPLVTMLATRQLTNQIDYVVLAMDIPYRVNSTSSKPNSTTSSLYYGFQPDTDPQTCSLPASSTNFYAGTEGIFRSTPPVSAASNAWLVTMITHSNLALAKQIVDSGVLSDGSFPAQTAYLAKSSDVARNVRFYTFDDALFNTRLRGNYSVQRTNSDYNWVFGTSLGLQQGVYYSSVTGTTFVPGSMADNLTSYGGQLFEQASFQLNCLQYVTAGAAGTYGTVTEPCNYLEKFPSPQNHFYQARGFSLAECYYQSLTNPYMGVVVGEPLAAPFAVAPLAAWQNLPGNALLAGTTNLSLQANAADPSHPIQQVDLFLDGLYLQTLTNIAPARSNLLNVTINGQSINYLVPLNANLKSIAAGLTDALNSSANSNVTKVAAYAHGDRIELKVFDRSKKGPQVAVTVSNSIGAATSATTWISASRTSFLDTLASGLRSFRISGTATPGSFLLATVTKTNSTQFTFAVTNLSNSSLTQMAQQLINSINSSADMISADGLTGQDLLTEAVSPLEIIDFNFLANGIGWDAAQIQVNLIGSFSISPLGNVTLEDNVADLQPRNHLYLRAGVTNLPLVFPFSTSALANGFHELSAVVYEGSHVRTQQRAAQTVFVQNGPLGATFTFGLSGTNVAVESSLPFTVTANTNNVSKIELFSTGGSLGLVTGQSNATFSIAGTNLGMGLHPFYAIVTGAGGKQYRTETRWIRLVGADTPFVLLIHAPPPSLSWPATAGRSYDIMSATNLADAFQLRTTVVATNGQVLWTDTNSTAAQRFYRVRTSN